MRPFIHPSVPAIQPSNRVLFLHPPSYTTRSVSKSQADRLPSVRSLPSPSITIFILFQFPFKIIDLSSTTKGNLCRKEFCVIQTDVFAVCRSPKTFLMGIKRIVSWKRVSVIRKCVTIRYLFMSLMGIVMSPFLHLFVLSA